MSESVENGEFLVEVRRRERLIGTRDANARRRQVQPVLLPGGRNLVVLRLAQLLPGIDYVASRI